MIKVNIKGAIVDNDDKWIYDMFGLESTSPGDVSNIIEGQTDDVEVIINSGGGNVYAGSEIYTALRGYKGNVNVKIVGIAASAASLIACAGNNVQISPTAQIMIHNVSSIVAGDHNDMKHEAEVLEGYNKSIANAYIDKTGKSEEEVLALMDYETWMNAQQAVENGFADSIMFANDTVTQLSADSGVMLPQNAINKMKEIINKDNTPQITFELDYDKLSNLVVEKLNETLDPNIKKNNKEQKDESSDVKNNGFERFIF